MLPASVGSPALWIGFLVFVLAMRSLYFLLAGIVQKFVYLKVGLAVVLIFVGAKMLVADLFRVPIALSLSAIVAILALSVLASLAKTRRDGPAAPRKAPVPG